MKIGIIGAGASGMVAAIAAATAPANEVTLFERQARVGRKLLVTGNGRCNLSNWNAEAAHYHGAAQRFTGTVLAHLPVDQTLQFFSGLGLHTVTEPGGRIYPYSDQANSVVDVLRFALQRPNIRLYTGCEIRAVRRTADGFVLQAADRTVTVDRLIVACGGAAGAAYGGSLSGYQLLQSLGHHTTQLFPALVQLKTDTAPIKGLKGVRANAALRLVQGACLLAEAQGEVQFTDYGVSGPAVFELSRAAAQTACQLQLDLLPALSEDALLSMLCLRISQHPQLSCADLLTGILHNRLGRVLLRSAEIAEAAPLETLSWPKLTALAKLVHAWTLPVLGTLGMEQAQVTAGGVEAMEFDPNTLQSRIVPGLYACGEVLDVDGDCGGYNLQWAWASGHLAGRCAGK